VDVNLQADSPNMGDTSTEGNLISFNNKIRLTKT